MHKLNGKVIDRIGLNEKILRRVQHNLAHFMLMSELRRMKSYLHPVDISIPVRIALGDHKFNFDFLDGMRWEVDERSFSKLARSEEKYGIGIDPSATVNSCMRNRAVRSIYPAVAATLRSYHDF